jgi:hypothetical protein
MEGIPMKKIMAALLMMIALSAQAAPLKKMVEVGSSLKEGMSRAKVMELTKVLGKPMVEARGDYIIAIFNDDSGKCSLLLDFHSDSLDKVDHITCLDEKDEWGQYKVKEIKW